MDCAGKLGSDFEPWLIGKRDTRKPAAVIEPTAWEARYFVPIFFAFFGGLYSALLASYRGLGVGI
jgi:hypothetical protein